MNTPVLQKVVSIPFTEEEARITLQLFDAAVRARGLEVAEVVAILAKKINESFKERVGPDGEAGVNGPPDGPGCRGPAGPVSTGNDGACAAVSKKRAKTLKTPGPVGNDGACAAEGVPSNVV